MATPIRNTSPDRALIVDAYNAVRVQLAGTKAHLESTPLLVVGANASDEAGAIVLGNEITDVLTAHIPNAYAHKAAIAAVLGIAGAVTAEEAYTAANANKAAYNTHRALTTAHYTVDSTNVVDVVDATTEGTLVALVNQLKSMINAHAANTVSGTVYVLVPA